MQDASEEQQEDEGPAPEDPRCEDLDLDEVIHACAECDRYERPCWCAAAEG